MKSIAFYNNKGGVAKTTSVINVGYELARENRVLLSLTRTDRLTAPDFSRRN